MLRLDFEVKRFGAELAFAFFLLLIGGAAVAGALQMNVGWKDDGPGAGFFPLLVGLVLCAACLVQIVLTLKHRRALQTPIFDGEAVRNLSGIIVPTALCAAAIPVAGIYLPAAFLLAYFVHRRTERSPIEIVAIATAVPTALYLLFDVALEIKLPGGWIY